jgi:hypothetical protein
VQLAFPNYQNIPAILLQLDKMPPVTQLGPSKFSPPESLPAFRRVCLRASFVAVPEAPMDEDDLAQAPEHDIRGSWKVSAMKPVTVAE